MTEDGPLEVAIATRGNGKTSDLVERLLDRGAERGIRVELLKRPSAEVELPGATTEDLRNWAGRIEVENPINFHGTENNLGLVVTDQPFMGVELSFMHGDDRVFTLTLFAGGQATAEERAVMES